MDARRPDLSRLRGRRAGVVLPPGGGRDRAWDHAAVRPAVPVADLHVDRAAAVLGAGDGRERDGRHPLAGPHRLAHAGRSEEHTSELQSLMRISYAVFCLKKKKTTTKTQTTTSITNQPTKKSQYNVI